MTEEKKEPEPTESRRLLEEVRKRLPELPPLPPRTTALTERNWKRSAPRR